VNDNRRAVLPRPLPHRRLRVRLVHRISLKTAIVAIKVAVTVASFIVLAGIVGREDLGRAFTETRRSSLALAVLIGLTQIPIAALRWRLIIAFMIRRTDIMPTGGTILRVTWSTNFLGQVMPFIAGDAGRVLMAMEAGLGSRTAFKSTLLDRCLGAAFLVMIAAAALFASPLLMRTPGVRNPASLGLATLAVSIVVTLWCSPLLARTFHTVPVAAAVTDALLDARRIAVSGTTGLLIALLCLIVHAQSMLIFGVLAAGQGIKLSSADVAAIVPLMLLVSMVPIAVGGWGLRELFLVTLLGALGIAPESALLLGISFGAVILVSTLPGALLLLLPARPHRTPRQPT
jgi:glycosyltransferase 2 family protein